MAELENADLADQVIRTIAETQRISPDTISIDNTFEELKIDSLDGINIVFALENKFNITIPDESVRTLKTVRETVDGVRTLLESQGGPSGGGVPSSA